VPAPGRNCRGRFILGIGTNNPAGAAMRALNYGRPVTYMREYPAAMKAAAYNAPRPPDEPPVLLAANNRKMLALAGSDADGTLTYFVPPEHTAEARHIVGESKRVCTEQAVLLETDQARAPPAGREYMKFYLTLPASRKISASSGSVKWIWRMAAVIGWSTRLSRGATKPNSASASRLITRQARITYAFCS
jgi:alkanesulfonate monooxygenase SsuD/methylene tetrahydromethanopterin reductase-like flavin-dependent oxidoreductase (luciferase family)